MEIGNDRDGHRKGGKAHVFRTVRLYDGAIIELLCRRFVSWLVQVALQAAKTHTWSGVDVNSCGSRAEWGLRGDGVVG